MSRRKPFRLPKFNLLGIGFVYVLIYLPQFWMVKIGYSGVSVGNRAKSVSKAVFGMALPIGVMVVPFAWHIEQFAHSLFGGLKWDFYKGQGHTETFIFPAHISILIVWYGMYLNYVVAMWFLDVNFSALIDAAVNSL